MQTWSYIVTNLITLIEYLMTRKNTRGECMKTTHADIHHSVFSFAACSHHPNRYTMHEASICISAVQVVIY